MSRALAALAGALVLAGCPIPQPVPDYPPGSITPPRILVDQMSGSHVPVQFVPAGCVTTAPTVPLGASVLDTNSIETITARWFVNYEPSLLLNRQPVSEQLVPPDADPTVLTRAVGPFVFEPYQHPAAPGTGGTGVGPTYPEAGVLRVVELVVSNGFDPQAETTAYTRPFRTTLPGFETQVFRWVFLSVPESGAHPCPP